MKKRAILFFVLMNGIFYSTFALDKIGIEFYKFGQFELAKTILLNQYQNAEGADKAIISYYLGEIYFKEEKRDSAAFYFNIGLASNPEYVFNEIGMAKLQFKEAPALAEAALKKIANKNKKKADVFVGIAKAYFDNGKKEAAFEAIENAKKINNKYGEAYVLAGDIYMAEQNHNKASSAYGQALNLDKQCKEAYLRYANIYATVNAALAIQTLEELVALDPSSPLAQKTIAEAYYANKQFDKAVAAYSNYAASEYCSPSDLTVYTAILFFSGNYEKSTEYAAAAVKANPNDFVMNRLLMYNYFEQKKYEEGLAVAEKFMSLQGTQKQAFTSTDYLYYARLLQKNKQADAAIPQFKKVLELDSSAVSVYKEIIDIYEAKGDYDNAIANYNIYIKDERSNARINDYLALGRFNYLAGVAIKDKDDNSMQKRTHYLMEADTLFGYVAEKVPDNFAGNFWRARTNVALDPETEQGLAKPYYEAALTLMDPAKDVKQIIECYQYFGSYYVRVKEDKATSKSYWNKILELDPNNDSAIRALKLLK